MTDFRFALRTLLHGRAYFIAIFVLAAAIGMSTAVFSLARAVLFHALPFTDESALRVIWKADEKSGVPFLELAYPELRDLQQGVPAFASVAVMPTTLYGYGKVIRFGNRAPVQVESAPVSHDFFQTLGVRPMIGRDFNAGDEHPGAAPVAILSYSTWRGVFHQDGGIVGKPVTLNGAGYRVIGVMAPELDFPRGVGLWVPMGVSAALEDRGMYFMQAIARVKPGYSDAQVTAQVNGLFRRLAKEYSGDYSPTQQGVITPLTDYWVGSARLQLLVSLGASFLLLLTGWVTASNLFLSRALARSQEIATRSSLGAGTRQIVAQFATQSLMAAAIAGIAGLCLAALLIRILVALAPADIPRLADAGISWEAVGFGIVLSLVTALACSLAPAVIATRMNLETLLREGGVRLTGSRRGRRMQNLFTMGQVAVTAVLLTASTLVVISVRAMLKTDTGFANLDTVTMNLALRGPQMDEARRRIFYTRLMDALRHSPAVTGVGAVLVRPLEGTIGWDMPYRSQSESSKRPEELPVANFEVITPGYFQTVGTPLLKGRDFGEQDREDTEKTVIISQDLARRVTRQGQVPLGQMVEGCGSSGKHSLPQHNDSRGRYLCQLPAERHSGKLPGCPGAGNRQ
jgi:predicted permease